MTNVYLTTILGGATTVAGTVAGVGLSTLDATKSVKKYKKASEAEEKANKKIVEDSKETDNFDLAVHAIQILNPEAEIRKGHPVVDQKAKKRIFIDTHGQPLKVPDGYRYDRTLGITNQGSTTSGKFVSIQIEKLEGVDEKLLESKVPKITVDKEPFKDLATTTLTSAAITITSTILTHNAYAATYDAKTYMDALTDDQLMEMCVELENKDLDELLLEEEVPEVEEVKQLVK